jgi:hypothetical protein
MMMMKLRQSALLLPRAALAAILCASLFGCQMPNDIDNLLPRSQTLPLFNPRVTTFTCEAEATKVPPIDAQAEAWFLEARALEDPEIYIDDRDYKIIVRLTRQAAERRHWKAMLNLASFYLEQQDPPHGVQDALKLVEDAMRLGIPAAYDRMGTYYMNGTGVRGDLTKAYAFWQKAAQMGNPQALAFLAEKLNAGPDSEDATHWSNIPIATKMLECAFGQGYGPAAYDLHYLYASPRDATGWIIGHDTSETKARALKVLHEGVKFGCERCASALSIEFGDPFDLADMLAPYVDKARGDRYRVLSNALGFNPDRRFPNLDKIVPLPPAILPPWDGKRESLLAAAMGVSAAPAPPPKPGIASHYTDRRFLDAGFKLRPVDAKHADHKSDDSHAPVAGYWRPTANQQPASVRAALAGVVPGLYRAGEKFEHFLYPDGEGRGPIPGVVWERFETIRHNHGAIEPLAPAGLTREVSAPAAPMERASDQACPVTGIWQPWLHPDHRMRAIVNQHWRQCWLNAGQVFPQPERDWLLALPAADVTWYLMDRSGIKEG